MSDFPQNEGEFISNSKCAKFPSEVLDWKFRSEVREAFHLQFRVKLLKDGFQVEASLRKFTKKFFCEGSF